MPRPFIPQLCLLRVQASEHASVQHRLQIITQPEETLPPCFDQSWKYVYARTGQIPGPIWILVFLWLSVGP